MTPRPPRSTRTDSLCPYTALVRSTGTACEARAGDPAQPAHADDAGRRTGRGDRAGDLVGVPAAEGAGRRGAGRPERRAGDARRGRSEEHTSELQSLMRISYAVFCLKKKNKLIHKA